MAYKLWFWTYDIYKSNLKLDKIAVIQIQYVIELEQI